MVPRFFFEPAVTKGFMAMTKGDVRLFLDAFYEENPGARKVWDSWKKTDGVPENTYLVNPATIEQNMYATLGESRLSLDCLNTFKTKKQLNAEWEQQRQRQQEEARIRHEGAINLSKWLPSVDLSKVPYKTFSASKTEPAGVTTSEPLPLPPGDFSILAPKRPAPVKKAWWKFC
jgi:hypothetical protein